MRTLSFVSWGLFVKAWSFAYLGFAKCWFVVVVSISLHSSQLPCETHTTSHPIIVLDLDIVGSWRRRVFQIYLNQIPNLMSTPTTQKSKNYEITSIKIMLKIWSVSKTWLLLFGCASWTNKAISQTCGCGGSFKRHGAILFHFKLSWKEVLWSHVHSWVSNQPYNVLVCFWIL